MANIAEVDVVDPEEAEGIALRIASILKAGQGASFSWGRKMAPRRQSRSQILVGAERAAQTLAHYSRAEKIIVNQELPKAVVDAQVALRMRPDVAEAKKKFLGMSNELTVRVRFFSGSEKEALESLRYGLMKASKNAGLILEILDKTLEAAGIQIPEDTRIGVNSPRAHAVKGRPRRPRPKPTR